jgi:dGTPase
VVEPPKPAEHYTRIRDESVKNAEERRYPGERDCDRILYSSALRRLAGVTQVAGAHESHVFHNRLTHSIRVAQLSRRIAEKVQRTNRGASDALCVDASVAEAAGLAHDLGHPPFGHVAEETLDDLLTNDFRVPDGFEGNPQSFRIVTRLSMRDPGVSPGDRPPGLNLTLATLDGMLKYPWLRNLNDDKKKDKWGAYNTEGEELGRARHGRGPNEAERSPEAEIMDWADDVTYAVHDVEDFYRAGLVPLERLASDDETERESFYAAIEANPHLLKRLGRQLTDGHKKSFKRAVSGYPLNERYTGTSLQRAHLRYFLSVQLGQYVNAFDFREDGGKFVAWVDEETRLQVEMLKLLTWHYVIHNPSLATQQYGQRRIIRKLFEIFHDAGTDPKGKKIALIPLSTRSEVQAAGKESSQVARLVADLICSFTERQSLDLYRRLSGVDPGSILDDLSR